MLYSLLLPALVSGGALAAALAATVAGTGVAAVLARRAGAR